MYRKNWKKEVKLDVLIVEDEAILAMVYRQRLQELGDLDVEHAFDAETALLAVERCLPKVILLDIKLRGEIDGIEMAEIVRRRYDVPIVFITAYSDADTLHRAWRTRPVNILNKVGDGREMKKVVAGIMNLQQKFS
jgi:CheY-like chemotaxis protein